MSAMVLLPRRRWIENTRGDMKQYELTVLENDGEYWPTMMWRWSLKARKVINGVDVCVVVGLTLDSGYSRPSFMKMLTNIDPNIDPWGSLSVAPADHSMRIRKVLSFPYAWRGRPFLSLVSFQLGDDQFMW